MTDDFAGEQILDAHEILTDDRLFGQEVRIQDVKPSLRSGPETIGRFLKAVDGYESTVTRLGTLGSQVRHPHPWFGPMTAHDWHCCLAAIHHWVHRRQLERILESFVMKPGLRHCRDFHTPFDPVFVPLDFR